MTKGIHIERSHLAIKHLPVVSVACLNVIFAKASYHEYFKIGSNTLWVFPFHWN
jgi:hypothetical protein